MSTLVHVPVMVEEVLAWLVSSREDPLLLDCTMGEGGHAERFLQACPGLLYAGIDADPEMRARAAQRLAVFGSRVTVFAGFFDEVLERFLASGGLPAEVPRRPDLILFDLGISMYHFALSGRGFSYAGEERLDMRLSPELPMSAADLVNGLREEELARIIFEYGEERHSRRIASALIRERQSNRIETAGRLADIVHRALPPAARTGARHCATRTFQALRIAVNDELGRAERGIMAGARLLHQGGRLAAISFHSLEDRIVKTSFRTLAGRDGAGDREIQPEYRILTKKPLLPGEAETRTNPPSRSAKLRVIERCPPEGRHRAPMRRSGIDTRSDTDPEGEDDE